MKSLMKFLLKFLMKFCKMFFILTISSLPIISLSFHAFFYLFDNNKRQSILEYGIGMRQFLLMSNTIFISFTTAILSIIISLLVALFLVKYINIPIRLMAFGIAFTILIPQFIHAQAWIFFLDKLNLILAKMGWIHMNFTGFGAAILVTTAAYFPISLSLLLFGISTLREENIEAGLLYGNEINCVTKIVIPQILPYIVIGFNLIFLQSICEYGIPSIFGINVYALQIFSVFSSTNDHVLAFYTSLPILPIAIVVAFTTYLYAKKINFVGFINNNHITSFKKMKYNFEIKLFMILGMLTFLLIMILPIVNLSIETTSIANYLDTMKNSQSELIYSTLLSLFTAFLCCVIAFIGAKGILGSNPFEKLIWSAIIILPFVFPATLQGISLLYFWTGIPNITIYGTVLLPVFALVSRFLPIAVLVYISFFITIDKELNHASSIYSISKWKYLYRIYLPLHKTSYIVAFAIVFAFSFGELGSTLMTTPPGFNTYTMKIYNYLHYGASETVAALCLTVLVLCLFIVFILFLQIRKSSKRN
jgi:iron(III) transport system permease protein